MLLERLTQVVTELTALQGDAEKADRGNKAELELPYKMPRRLYKRFAKLPSV